MRRFLTAYRHDGSPILNPDAPEALIGSFSGDIWARDWAHAKRLAKKRGIGEIICGEVRGKQYWRYPSETMRMRKRDHDAIFHGLAFLGWLALKSGAATADEILGDYGILHEYAHVRGGASILKKLIPRVEAIERRVPGYKPPAPPVGP